MVRYSYSYQTIVQYDDMATNHHFLLRCQPRVDCGIMVVDESVDLLSQASITEGVDVFGNRIIYGSISGAHDLFVVASRGVVECGRYMEKEAFINPIYRAFTAKTQPSDQISQFGLATPCIGSALEQMLSISERLYVKMQYSPGVTSADSSAAESFAIGAGVCQDYAHLLISLARDRGIAARYVAGLVTGTGETHAWVEIHSDGYWYGIDATHNLLIEQGYIKLAHGRDAQDCSVSRGMHTGAAGHTTDVRVVVKEIK